MNEALALFLAVVAGGMVGLCSAAFYTVLKLPMRVMHVCGVEGDAVSAWALTLGITGATLLSAMQWSLHLPSLAFGAAMLLAGLFTGGLAAALSEILDVLPYTLDRLHLGRSVTWLLWALAIGKTIGAFCGTIFVK